MVSETARRQALEELLNPSAPVTNVIGFGSGIKWTNGEPTGQEATLVFVTQKLPETTLSSEELVPAQMADGTPTDVVALGPVVAQANEAELLFRYPEQQRVQNGHRQEERSLETLEAEPQLLRKRMRPCPSGASIGHVDITAGTLGSVVYDFLPGATTDPPGAGLGIPPTYYVLSNNHVLANSNQGHVGSAIVQPGPYDGGVLPQDVIAKLTRFIPIQFAPQVPLDRQNNIVDAAIAECEFSDATRETYFSGSPRAWRRRANVAVGDLVKKTGRTTNLTTGRVISVDATIDVGYGIGTARFRDQIVTTNMSAGGDSGSLVTSYDNVAVGLLFAGSSQATILNQIENVRRLLRIEVAETLG
jgi:hypothetical protein